MPQPDGESSKVKVKVRFNVHGIFSVSSASLIENQKGEVEDMQIDAEPLVQNEGRAEEQVKGFQFQILTHLPNVIYQASSIFFISDQNAGRPGSPKSGRPAK